MQLYGALILLVTLSAALGLRCHLCVDSNTPSCPNIITCSPAEDRCAAAKVNERYSKGCLNRDGCRVPGVECCEQDLCNGAIPTGSSVLLLLVSSAIMTVFL